MTCPFPQPVYTSTHTISQVSEVIVKLSTDAHGPFDCDKGRRGSRSSATFYLIIDSTWAGGLTTWRKAAVMAKMYQIPLTAHHDPQIHIHAQAASPTAFILESFADPARDPLWFELFSERPAIVNGYMSLLTHRDWALNCGLRR